MARDMTRFRRFFASGAFLFLLAGSGLLLLTWPLVTLLQSGGPSGQFYGLFAVWGALILGAFAWAKSQAVPKGDGCGDDADGQADSCAWSPEEGGRE